MWPSTESYKKKDVGHTLICNEINTGPILLHFIQMCFSKKLLVSLNSSALGNESTACVFFIWNTYESSQGSNSCKKKIIIYRI